MNILELFEFPDFKGLSAYIDKDTDDLATVGFLMKAQSVRVHGDPWIIFGDGRYKGKFLCFKEGSYNSIPAFAEKISSARCVKDGLYNPKITLFEHINYGGKVVTLEKPADNLKSYALDNKISSHKDVSGAWVLYSEKYYKGDSMVTVAGDAVPNYCCWNGTNWNDKTRSLKPVLAYVA